MTVSFVTAAALGKIFNYAISIFALGFIIFFHELGHFLLAKKNGICVIEFSVGMGPRLFSFKKGETRYSLKWIPFGGSCMMQGEDGGIPDAAPEPDPEDAIALDPERSFADKSVWARISVIAAGPLFNFLLAFLCSLVIMGTIGADTPEILGVIDGYPAQEAGLAAGDEILSINGEKMVFYRDVLLYLQLADPTETMQVVYERDGAQYETELHFQYDEDAGRYYIGIQGSTSYRQKLSPVQVVRYSLSETRYNLELTLKSLQMLFTGKASVNDLSGPVGITNVMTETVESAKSDGALYVFLNILNLMILISANLGVMNLLPIPALDGGRLFFLLIEAVRGKPVSREKEGIVHIIGFVLLMILMVFVVFNDIRKLFF